MCLGIPGEIIELVPDRPDLATVDIAGVRRVISVELLGEGAVRPGDWVLVHVGCAMSKIDPAEAQATLTLLRGLGPAHAGEPVALAESDIT